ncbi:MAG TPA: aminotransferase class I/II-fold pyridoxal phosphate-dependent enzyme [Dissulfurispiraceae bacterium]|nr:aminotransferase class I/II-fold pyridoxal phosphate-dependent enzyme [Dissulfurispiraceae bacterium]
MRGLARVVRDRDCSAPLSSGGTARIILEGKEFLHFSSNDYLGLACHPDLVAAALAALDACGTGAGAARLLGGGTHYHRLLEKQTAQFKGTEDALLFNSGYTANLSTIPALAGKGDVIFSDELNHASIIDGCRLSRAKTVIYRHCNADHLKELLRTEQGKRRLVITDSVFSMDGNIAPIPALSAACRTSKALLYIDDAHGTGVLGGGYGVLRHFGILPEDHIIQMGTYSKALGSFGAFAAAPSDIIQWLLNAARGFIFSTALPASVAAASLAALRLVETADACNARLWTNRTLLVEGLTRLGYDVSQSETPILPLFVGDIGTTLRCGDYLRENGIFAPAIRPPTVAAPRIRLTVTAGHTEDDIRKLLNVLAGWTSV